MKQLTDEEYRKSGYREKLDEFLRSEAGSIALEIIACAPSVIPLGPNGLHQTDAVLARVLAESVGVNRALSQLRKLAEPMRAETDSADLDKSPNRPDGFDYLPEPLKEVLREQYRNQQAQPPLS